jgi:hypothetical protein
MPLGFAMAERFFYELRAGASRGAVRMTGCLSESTRSGREFLKDRWRDIRNRGGLYKGKKKERQPGRE